MVKSAALVLQHHLLNGRLVAGDLPRTGRGAEAFKDPVQQAGEIRPERQGQPLPTAGNIADQRGAFGTDALEEDRLLITIENLGNIGEVDIAFVDREMAGRREAV